MIDRLQRLAMALRFLRLPSLILGLVSAAYMVASIFAPDITGGDDSLVASVVLFMWALLTSTFLSAFRSVPEPADKSWRFFPRLKRRLLRAWYWLIGVLFIGATLFALLLSFRLFRAG